MCPPPCLLLLPRSSSSLPYRAPLFLIRLPQLRARRPRGAGAAPALQWWRVPHGRRLENGRTGAKYRTWRWDGVTTAAAGAEPNPCLYLLPSSKDMQRVSNLWSCRLYYFLFSFSWCIWSPVNLAFVALLLCKVHVKKTSVSFQYSTSKIDSWQAWLLSSDVVSYFILVLVYWCSGYARKEKNKCSPLELYDFYSYADHCDRSLKSQLGCIALAITLDKFAKNSMLPVLALGF